MALTLRRDKGSALTYDELDDNFLELGAASSNWELISADYAVSVGESIMLDSSANGFIVTLPSDPITSNQILFADVADLSTNNVTLDGNGHTFENTANTLILDVKDVQVKLIYSNSSWQVFSSVGRAGYTGSKGDPGGYTGSKGEFGFSGSRGIIGFVGSKGDVGSLGYTGSRAYTGSRGFSGSRGSTGFVGSKGDIGSLGYTGSRGFSGSRGSTGFVGSKGDIGSLGYTGSRGSTGFTGSKGDIGYTGSGTVTSIVAGDGLSGGGSSSTVTVSHADTSSQFSVNNTDLTYIQDVGLDTYGHVTSLTSSTASLSDFGITATAAELNHVDGVTTSIQTQLDSKLSSHPNTSNMSGVYGNLSSHVIRQLTVDSDGHLLDLNSEATSTIPLSEFDNDEGFINLDANGDLYIDGEVKARTALGYASPTLPSNTVVYMNVETANDFYVVLSTNMSVYLQNTGLLTNNTATTWTGTLRVLASGTRTLSFKNSSGTQTNVKFPGGEEPTPPASGEENLYIIHYSGLSDRWYVALSMENLS